MKRITLAVGALLTCGAISGGLLAARQSEAQEAGGAPGAAETTRHGRYEARVDARVAGLQQALGLTEQQTAQVRTIFLDRHQALRETSFREVPDRAAMREARAAAHDELQQAVLAVLTPDQQAAYRTRVEAGPRFRGGPGMGERSGPFRPDGMRGPDGGMRGMPGFRGPRPG
jgi:hypothetical protein